MPGRLFLLLVLLALGLLLLFTSVAKAYPYKLVYWNDKNYYEDSGFNYTPYVLDVGRVPSSPGFSAGDPFYGEELWRQVEYWSTVNGWGWALSGTVTRVYNSGSNDYYFVMRGVSFSLDLIGEPLSSLKNYDPYTGSFTEKSGRSISYLAEGVDGLACKFFRKREIKLF